jgi:hypothetical protein
MRVKDKQTGGLRASLGVLFGFLFIAPAYGDLAFLKNATIEQVLVSGTSQYGGCMVRVSPSAATVISGCIEWLTMSCTGDHTSKSAAQSMLSQAQLAMITGQPAQLQINNQKTHNGVFCFVERIDTIKAGGTIQ